MSHPSTARAKRRLLILDNLPPSGHDHPNFLRLRALDSEILYEVMAMTDAELARSELLSMNAKTGVSLDFALSLTCHPTPLCAAVCYAGVPNAAATWEKSRRKRLRNVEIVRRDPVTAAHRVTNEFERFVQRWDHRRRGRFDFIQVNGSGDLFPESVTMVNELARLRPELAIWIMTRRLAEAAKIRPRPNVFLQVSLDATSTPAFVQGALAFVARHPRAYLSFLRSGKNDIDHGAAIIFNEKRTPGLPFRGQSVCPVDAGLLELGYERRGDPGDACARCRKCFSDRVLERQRELIERGAP